MSNWKSVPILFLIFCCIVTSVPLVYAETLTQTFDGGMDLEITYPNSVIIGRTFSVSIHLENNGWVSYYMEQDTTIPNKFICKPCGRGRFVTPVPFITPLDRFRVRKKVLKLRFLGHI